MPRFPLPRRGLRSLITFVLALAIPYLVLRHVYSIDRPLQHSASAAYNYLRPGAVGNHDASRRRHDARPGSPVTPDGPGPGSGPGPGLDPGRWGEDSIGVGYSRGRAQLGLDSSDREREPEPQAQAQAQAQGDRDRSKTRQLHHKLAARHEYLPNGLLEVNPRGRHPIYDLLDKGKQAWEDKLARQSKTLEQAVDEYRRRYSRSPPKGFDRWWSYVSKHNVQLPDEYDQIFHDLEPFHALTPSHLATLVRRAGEKEAMYTVTCHGKSSKAVKTVGRCSYKLNEKGLSEGTKRVAVERAEASMELIRPVERDLEGFEAVFYSHDVPWQFVGHEYRSALEDSAAVGEFLDPEEHDLDWAHLGWASACPPHKPLREEYDPTVLPDLEEAWQAEEKTFVWDHKATMDPCLHPELTHTMGFLSSHGKGPGPTRELYPVMAICKTSLHSDVLGVNTEWWIEDVQDDPAWEKKDERLLWRGKNTGIYFKKGVPWNISQRINLVNRTNAASFVSSGNTATLPVLPVTDEDSPVGPAQNLPLAQLNDDLMDIGFVDEPIQCDPDECKEIKSKYAFKGRKTWKEANTYKYQLDIDGNGWSARFKRVMTSNSVVLKSTIFPEWYSDRIQPWLHYIPIKPDLSDLYDVLTFFRSDKAHDALAKQIGAEGQVWSKTFWRMEDMVAYQFRLLLEYARLLAPDREAASYHDARLARV